MQKSLYLLCPTDHLETIIDHRFGSKNYFYSSLGNAAIFDADVMLEIKEMIQKHHIKEVFLVWSNENRIVLDALGNQNFHEIRSLNNLYSGITQQIKYTVLLKQSANPEFSMMSYCLKKKVEELQREFNLFFRESIKVRGKIYNKQKNTFHPIHADLTCVEKYSLN
ncbi:hypothetical protein [Spongiimicrobium salis]|uniref:hypothetical protein n=1 Tax=Spongiimicrobium salis TaxID=1667022 RepID=UPI00374D5761